MPAWTSWHMRWPWQKRQTVQRAMALNTTTVLALRTATLHRVSALGKIECASMKNPKTPMLLSIKYGQNGMAEHPRGMTPPNGPGTTIQLIG